MSTPVTLEHRGPLTLITLDDGKANAMSPRMIGAINDALDTAESRRSVVVMTGRPGVFSAGFDLKIMKSGGLQTLRMLRGGFELSHRLLSFPYPVVLACTGHAIAMGAFLTLSADYRVGADGPFTVRANEVAIGLTMPRAAVEICRQRLAHAHFIRATLLSESYTPTQAIEAGFLDRVVDPDAVLDTALEHAQSLVDLDMHAHAQSKLRVQHDTLRAIKRGIASDMRELTLLGAKELSKRALQSVARRRRHNPAVQG